MGRTLYIESARGPNNALEAAGKTPDWLGDAACNEGQHSTRHHAVNRAWHAALSAVATGPSSLVTSRRL